MEISDKDLRDYNKCSELWYNGGSKQDLEFQLFSTALSSLFSHALLQDVTLNTVLVKKVINYSFSTLKIRETYLENDIATLEEHLTLYLAETINHFASSIIISGPLPLRLRVSNTAVNVTLSGIVQETQAITGILCSPYKVTNQIPHDPILPLALQSLQTLALDFKISKKIKTQIKTISPTMPPIIKTFSELPNNKKVITITKMMQAKYHTPLLPCPYACTYKNKCFPER